MSVTTQRAVIGVEDFVYAVMTDGTDIAGGAATYGTVYSIPGLKQANYASNSGLTRLYGDNGVFAASEYVGDQSISIDLADVSPDDQNRLLGFGYANGALEKSATSVSPYVWVGFKLTLDGGYSRYVSIPKVKFNKPSTDATTKESSVAFSTTMIEGAILNLICNDVYMVAVRTDDTAASATLISNFFTTPVISKVSDLTALTVVMTQGLGATKTVLLTFSKASASGSIPFTIPAASITAIASSLQLGTVASGATAGPLSAVVLSAGTGFSNSTITVTVTTNLATTAVYGFIAANSAIRDSSGVPVTAYFSGTVTTRT
jgi:phi13 family phage major tail protein